MLPFIPPALPPNLSDYLQFLYGVVGIPTNILVAANSVATSGDTGTLTDLTQNWDNNQWVGKIVVDSTLQESSVVLSSLATQVTFTTPFVNPVNTGDQYQIVPRYVVLSLGIALDIANPDIGIASQDLYSLAVYNLAADRLLNYALDTAGQTFYGDQRVKFRLSDSKVGVPSSSADQGVAVGILNPEQLKMLTLQDLQTMKTPYGRTYMGLAQAAGPIWGMS